MTARKLRWHVTEFRKGLLDGGASESMCFVMSFALEAYLRVIGLKYAAVEVMVGKHHHWILWMPGDQIIDATADQFAKPDGSKMPGVFIGKRPDWYVPIKQESPQNGAIPASSERIGTRTK